MKYTTVSTYKDVQDILELQAINHGSLVDDETKWSQGFVTVRHDFDTLLFMNQQAPSVIAKSGKILAGYCLMMPREFRLHVPILEPMFQRLEVLSWEGKPLPEYNWFIMGQVCVGADFRGMGVFEGMYHQLRNVYAPNYDFVVTEISERNPRSIRAHEKVGFKILNAYTNAHTGENWQVVIWNWK